MKKVLLVLLLLPTLAVGQSPRRVVNDFYLDVARGEINYHSVIHKFGRNAAVANGVWERVNLLSVAATFPTAATTVRIKVGGNAADTAAGAGCREVTVQGITSTLAEGSEAIVTAGGSVSSSTTTSFWRVHRAWCSAAGTYGGANTGAVTIENTAGTLDIISIGATQGQSEFAQFTVPAGKSAYITNLSFTADVTLAADFRVLKREDMTDTTVPVKATRVQAFYDGVKEAFSPNLAVPFGPYPEGTDLWVEARGAGAATSVTADMEIVLVDD
jgi:hypothetical protein